MNKESLQYRRVDKCILNAFIKISPQIPFEKMTVQDILDEALVSRYTFYAHFHDKYEVAERIQDELYKQFLLLTEERIPSIESQALASRARWHEANRRDGGSDDDLRHAPGAGLGRENDFDLVIGNHAADAHNRIISLRQYQNKFANSIIDSDIF